MLETSTSPGRPGLLRGLRCARRSRRACRRAARTPRCGRRRGCRARSLAPTPPPPPHNESPAPARRSSRESRRPRCRSPYRESVRAGRTAAWWVEQLAPAPVTELGRLLGRTDDVCEQHGRQHSVRLWRLPYTCQELTDLAEDLVRAAAGPRHVVTSRQLDIPRPSMLAARKRAFSTWQTWSPTRWTIMWARGSMRQRRARRSLSRRA